MVPQLVNLLQPGCGEQLQCGVLRLLHNLSFDGALRQQMMAAGLVQQVWKGSAPGVSIKSWPAAAMMGRVMQSAALVQKQCSHKQ